jgi:hypothetical protein
VSDFISCAVFSALIVLAAAGLLVWHVRAWHAVRRRRADPAEFDFRRRQFRRRIQASAMLGLLGFAVFFGGLMMVYRLRPLAITLYWLAVIVVLAWLALLALADVLATKHYFGRIQDHYAVEQAKLRAELRRLQSVRGNGRSVSRKPKDGHH